MTDEQPEQAPPSFTTSVGGGATVGKLVNIGKVVGNVQIASEAPARALFQLQDDIRDFVGRRELHAELCAYIEQCAEEGQAGARVALYGSAGIGKSALAVHLAHSLKALFADLQLHVDLGGGAGSPLGPAEVLAGFLRALGINEPYPEAIDERAALYRSQLTGKRALVLLDNASDITQVRPLLPGSPSCVVIVTSRVPIGTLEGARTRQVEVLDRDDAVALLSEIAGSARIDAELQSAHEIVRMCGYLPLAVRIAGGRLQNQSRRSLAWMRDRLANESSRLGELELEDKAVRASFLVSYRELPADDARLFCQLAALPGPDFSIALVIGATAADPQQTERTLDRLVEAQLLESTHEDRYGFHDLLRLFADEQLSSEPVAMRQTIVQQADAWLAERSDAANTELATSHFASVDALAWFDAERQSLIAAIHTGHAAKRWNTVLKLTSNFTKFFYLRGYWGDWVDTHELALNAAHRTGNRRDEAEMLNNLGTVYFNQGRWEHAATHFTRALTICRELNDRRGEGNAVNNLGNVFTRQGRWDDAATNYKQALTIFSELGDRHREGQTLTNLGTVYNKQKRREDAAAMHEQALTIFRELGDRYGEGKALMNLGSVYIDQEPWDKAATAYNQALAIFRELGDRHGEGETLANLGNVCVKQGRDDDAIAAYEQALTILRKLGDRQGTGHTLMNLANVYTDQKRWEDAALAYTAALKIFQELGDSHNEERMHVAILMFVKKQLEDDGS